MSSQNPYAAERVRLHVEEPPQYHVLMHNDDFTTMEFVMQILENVFFKSESESYQLMMRVHREGYALVGSYTQDIAYSKVNKAVRLARASNYPLRFTINEA